MGITLVGTIVADIEPLYAAWMFMGQILLAFIASLFLDEDLRRLNMESEPKNEVSVNQVKPLSAEPAIENYSAPASMAKTFYPGAEEPVQVI